MNHWLFTLRSDGSAAWGIPAGHDVTGVQGDDQARQFPRSSWAPCAALRESSRDPSDVIALESHAGTTLRQEDRPALSRPTRSTILENSIASASISTASSQGHTVDALAPRADEGRWRLR